MSLEGCNDTTRVQVSASAVSVDADSQHDAIDEMNIHSL